MAAIRKKRSLKKQHKLKYIKKILLFAFVITLISCNSDSNETIQNDFKGYYKIISIVSETEIDLNNDGIGSLNIL
ncbi:hypothetical protein ACFSX9_02680 [Flavobacterium ardleyense]|uniref:Lipoprotein n=1 Tax=Flavobacterium ardleyense TaxID=2038737 RepID=A0ABW5Z570_9FLAO